jgi:hypothetical protein
MLLLVGPLLAPYRAMPRIIVVRIKPIKREGVKLINIIFIITIYNIRRVFYLQGCPHAAALMVRWGRRQELLMQAETPVENESSRIFGYIFRERNIPNTVEKDPDCTYYYFDLSGVLETN